MPLLPNNNPSVPLWKRKAFVAAVGGVLTSLVAVLAVVLGWSPETTGVVLGFVGAVLALWQSLATKAPSDPGVEDSSPTWTPPPSGPSSRSVLVGAGVALLVLAVAPAACTTRHVSPDPLPPSVVLDPLQACTVQVSTPTQTINLDVVKLTDTLIREVAALVDRALGGGTPPVLLSLATGAAKWGTTEGLCRAFEAAGKEIGSGPVEVRVFR